MQPPPSKKKLAQSAAEQVDLDDDDDDEAMADLRGAGRDAAAADSTEAGDLLEEQPVADEEEMWNAAKDEVLAIDEKKREAKDAKMDFFFDDPEMAVKIFFSAHYRDKGLIW